jgi:hypothetical protein
MIAEYFKIETGLKCSCCSGDIILKLDEDISICYLCNNTDYKDNFIKITEED